MIAKGLPRTSPILFVILMVVVVSCGTPATTPTPEPDPTPTEITQPTPSPGETPIAQPTPTSPPPAVVSPSGNLNIGQKELGAFAGHPRLTINPALFVNSTIPIGESLVTTDVDGNLEVPLLAESWSVSDDFLTWTFKLREGVQFHKDYGEMTAEDVVWSYQEWAQNDVHAGASVIRDFWQHPDGYAEATGRYTVEVNTGAPVPDLLGLVHMAIPSGRATWVTSKTQSEEQGAEAANRDIAATGPWEIVEHRTAQFWRMHAVENHWRKTPHFQELVFWEIPEESSLLAGFQTGELDTYVMAFDSIPLVETVPEAKVMSIPGAGTQFLTFYGQYYVGLGTEDQRDGYNPDLPFVSSNPNPDSLEWEHARMVREALLIAIDRRALIDTLLGGFARPSPAAIYDWVGNEHLLEPYTPWEHEPDRASELLVEAGYSDGFQITLTPAIRGAPAEAEVCEAIAAMWGDIGVDVNFQRVPYGTLRPSLASRTYQGATCHGGAGRVTPSQGYVLFHTTGGSSFGVEHPWLEGRISQAFQAVDPAERDQLDREIGQFFADNLLTNIALYRFDAVWPVGPRIEEWPQDVKGLDLRNINGYEFIRPRQ